MNVKIERKDGKVEYMTFDEFSRWMCYVEAMEFIKQKAIELKIDVINLIKPAAIDTYIKERFPAMRYDVEQEVKLGLL